MPAQRTTRSAARAAAATVSALSRPAPSAKASTSPPTSTTVSTTTSSSKKLPSPSLQTLHFPSAAAFDTWLTSNGSCTPSGFWLKISKKAIISQIPSVTYPEAVDTALCHGWIDGQRKSLDANSFIQRFTPRRKNSLWSQRNVDRVEDLIAQGRMRPMGQTEVDAAKQSGRWERAYAGSGAMETPKDFEEALEGNEAARVKFDNLNRSQRYSFLWRIETAKKPETRRRKIEQFVDMLGEGKML